MPVIHCPPSGHKDWRQEVVVPGTELWDPCKGDMKTELRLQTITTSTAAIPMALISSGSDFVTNKVYTGLQARLDLVQKSCSCIWASWYFKCGMVVR